AFLVTNGELGSLLAPSATSGLALRTRTRPPASAFRNRDDELDVALLRRVTPPYLGSGPSPICAGYFRAFASSFLIAADLRSIPATSANRSTPRSTSASSASTSSRLSLNASWPQRKSASSSPASLAIRAARLRGVWYFSQSRSRTGRGVSGARRASPRPHPRNTFSLC